MSSIQRLNDALKYWYGTRTSVLSIEVSSIQRLNNALKYCVDFITVRMVMSLTCNFTGNHLILGIATNSDPN